MARPNYSGEKRRKELEKQKKKKRKSGGNLSTLLCPQEARK
jgi:hypothetical protein